MKQNRSSSLFVRSLLAGSLICTASLLVSCSPALGPTMELTELPAVEQATGAKAGLSRAIAVATVQDTRSESSDFTAVSGDVTGLVKDAIGEILKGNGFELSSSAPLTLTASITKWRTKVETTSTTRVNSEASLSIEVKNSQGKRLYSGSYNGNRSATTPVASKNDIRFSLGTAMTEAINQIVQDPKLIRVLVGK